MIDPATLTEFYDRADRVAVVRCKIVTAARSILPVLLDAGRPNSAKELQELFFEMDAIDQELTSMLMGNLDLAIEVLKGRRIKP